MSNLTLQATRRNVLGKKTRFLRRQGITPIHLFGRGLESLTLQCDAAQLRRIMAEAGMTRLISLKIEDDNEPRSVFIREIQRDELSKQLLHIDFYQVRKEEKITIDVPIVLVGEAPAMKGKGRILIYGVTSLNIECLPDRVPPQIEVDLSPLQELDQAIYVKDIVLGSDITVKTVPDLLVVKTSEVAAEKVEVEVEKVAAEAVAEVPAEEEVPAEGKAAGQPPAES